MKKRILIVDESLFLRIEEMRGEMSPSEFITHCLEQATGKTSSIRAGRAAPARREKKEGSFSSGVDQLWLWGIILFGFGDTLTSVLVFALGGGEVNPILNFLLSLTGRHIWSFIAWKTLALLGIIYLYYKHLRSQWLIPVLIIFIGALLVTNNLISLIKLL